MALLDEAIEASGGLARWNSLTRFTLHLSIGGALFSHMGADALKEIVAEGSTRTQVVRFTGSNICGSCQPDCVTIESLDGRVLRSWHDPRRAFLDHASGTPWDELSCVFFCGFSVWNHLTTPFLLTHPGVALEELPPMVEDGQRWRRLRGILPPEIAAHSAEQVFYFDDKGHQRRTDHDLLGDRVANFSWAHQKFGDIVVPTLRRSMKLGPGGTIIPKPVLIDLEIFDARFE